MSYTLVIVDDDIWTVRKIEKDFYWAAHNMTVSASFTSPFQAIEYIKQNSPDVVMTDIAMPGMTGFELAQRLAADMDRPPEIILVTGYDEYQYIRKAIHLGVFDYCLKPVNPADANEVLARLRAKLDARAAKVSEQKCHGFHFVSETLNKMLEYINANLHGRLRLSAVAKQFYISPNYASSLFVSHLNMTFTDYLFSQRMEKAEEMLRDTNASVAHIAESVGFENYSYFNKCFSKHFGTPPKQFRVNSRKKEDLSDGE